MFPEHLVGFAVDLAERHGLESASALNPRSNPPMPANSERTLNFSGTPHPFQRGGSALGVRRADHPQTHGAVGFEAALIVVSIYPVP
jgi:hypothetical protein